MKNILVCGGRGFIGFNALNLWTRMHPTWSFVNVDANTYADRFMADNKDEWLNWAGIPSFTLDLGADNAEEAIDSLVETFDIDTICIFSAESHVDNSLTGPKLFFESNVMGTVNVLDVARKRDLRVHYVSTDEVYGITYPTDETTVDSPFKPSSPYSSSKASADLIVQSYMKSFGLKATISRCSNNFGPWQMTEKLIPTILTKLENKEKIPVYGDGRQCRQWIHVNDHNLAILDLMEGKPGVIANVSSNRLGYMMNIDIIHFFAEMYGRKLEDVIEHVEDRKAHDTSYYITNYRTLDYGTEHIKEKLAETYSWYKTNLFTI